MAAMIKQRSKPGDILLDLLRGMPAHGRSVKTLVDWGDLFGFSENIVRVTLSRLLARGLIESPSRGRYRLAHNADAVNDFVERWRLGEQRTRTWHQNWLFSYLREPHDRSIWALEAWGFKAVEPQLFVRPDNLNLEPEDLTSALEQLGLQNANLVLGQPLLSDKAREWVLLWHPEDLNQQYSIMLNALEESSDRLHHMPTKDARLESFRIGGEGIHLLAKDPLLPKEMVDTRLREALWQALLAYDALGKAIWVSSSGEVAEALPIPSAQQ